MSLRATIKEIHFVARATEAVVVLGLGVGVQVD